eukprot:scaffold207977_cov35-Tisochrysis_lutea.AAC.3
MELKALGLPPNVIEAYESAGVTQLHPWQLEALEVPGVTSGGENRASAAIMVHIIHFSPGVLAA